MLALKRKEKKKQKQTTKVKIKRKKSQTRTRIDFLFPLITSDPLFSISNAYVRKEVT